MYVILSAFKSGRHATYNARRTTELLRRLDAMHCVQSYQLCKGVYQGESEISVLVDCGWDGYSVQLVVDLAFKVADQQCCVLLPNSQEKAMLVYRGTDIRQENWTHTVEEVTAPPVGEDYTDLLNGNYLTLKEIMK